MVLIVFEFFKAVFTTSEWKKFLNAHAWSPLVMQEFTEVIYETLYLAYLGECWLAHLLIIIFFLLQKMSLLMITLELLLVQLLQLLQLRVGRRWFSSFIKRVSHALLILSNLLYNLSHSGDLLQLVFVRRRASSFYKI